MLKQLWAVQVRISNISCPMDYFIQYLFVAVIIFTGNSIIIGLIVILFHNNEFIYK
jgi:hypothetical protein